VKIAIIGTSGAPARYGGFEIFVEEVAMRLVIVENLLRDVERIREEDWIGI